MSLSPHGFVIRPHIYLETETLPPNVSGKMKTADELRATNAARQRKWRKTHRWVAEQRRLAQYGKSKVQLREEETQPPACENQPVRDELGVKRPEQRSELIDGEENFMEKTYLVPNPDEEWAPEQQAAIAARERRAGVAQRPPAKSAPGSRPVNAAKAWDAPGPRTEHEIRMKEEAERFVAKKKEREAAVADRHRRRAGVRTELDC